LNNTIVKPIIDIRKIKSIVSIFAKRLLIIIPACNLSAAAQFRYHEEETGAEQPAFIKFAGTKQGGGREIKLNYLPDIPRRTLVSAEGAAVALGRRSWPLDRGSWSCEGAVGSTVRGTVIPPAVSVPAPSVVGKA